MPANGYSEAAGHAVLHRLIPSSRARAVTYWCTRPCLSAAHPLASAHLLVAPPWDSDKDSWSNVNE
jgi:hypothetical protein